MREQRVDNSNSIAQPRRRYLGALRIVVRILIALLVGWGIYHAFVKARDEMHSRRLALQQEIDDLAARRDAADSPEERQILVRETQKLTHQLSSSPWSAKPLWLGLAGFFYLAGLLPNAIFWRAIMRALGARPSWLTTLRAYYIGHLGKYVPGKAMVVVLRTGLAAGPETAPTVAAVAVFIETLTMMAVGAMVASLVLVFYSRHILMLALAVGLVIAAGLPTTPPIFRRLVRIVKLKAADPNIEASLDGLNYSLMVRGWLLVAAGWCLLGLSLWATLQALPVADLPLADSWSLLPVLTACVALAMVLGFVSLLPGGAGVREWVVMTLVAPLPGVGAFPALAAAIWLRIIWLVSELAISFILYVTPSPVPAKPVQEDG